MPGVVDHPLRPRALLVASRGAWQLRDQVRALALADEALGLVPDGDEDWREAQEYRAGALILLERAEESIESAAAAVGDPPDFGSGRTLRRQATWLLLRNLTHGPDIDAALELLAHAKTSNVTTHALALHVVGAMLASTDRRAAVDYQRAAVDLSGSIGSALVHGFALHALAVAEAQDNPREGVRRYADMLTHYLRLGNRTHLREFARGSVVPLVDCQQWEAAATVQGDDPRLSPLPAHAGEAHRSRRESCSGHDRRRVRGSGRSRRSYDRRGARRLRVHGRSPAVIAEPGCPEPPDATRAQRGSPVQPSRARCGAMHDREGTTDNSRRVAQE